MCWGVTDAAMEAGAEATNSAASRVVMCSITTRSSGTCRWEVGGVGKRCLGCEVESVWGPGEAGYDGWCGRQGGSREDSSRLVGSVASGCAAQQVWQGVQPAADAAAQP